jgi:nitrate/TMAO reductase-like tetraheme cytochrome c subunit
MKKKLLFFLLVLLILWQGNASAQISPGELSNAHAKLEGVSNCTKCHEVGNKVSREKCLNCHKPIKLLIDAQKGYHSSNEVKGKDCFICHNDHHGRNFQIIKFDKTNFNHSTTGFELKGVHARKDCKSCHKAEFIKDPELKKNTSTYLGLGTECLSCHDDFHKGKMSPNCSGCHGFESFKNVTGFDHNTTKFPLLGKHKIVVCDKCHKSTIVDGKAVRQLVGIEFSNCTSCHKDVHENKFGQNCKQCHTEESFHTIKGVSNFDHSKTDFKLVGKHQFVACKSCHITNLTNPIKFDRCTNCHTDYHKFEFVKNGIAPDCNQCHTNNGFSENLFTVEKHNVSNFKLEGAHLATPCIFCHKKQERWAFRKIGLACADCHQNIHKGIIQEKYYPDNKCTVCHNVNDWKTISFDHNQTKFKLEGVHANRSCSFCHITKNETGKMVQQFAGLSTECSGCHKNSHAGQFDIGGQTDCTRCHGFDDWKKTKFNHNSSKFKLEGAHLKVSCEKCHKEEAYTSGKVILYKNNKILCSNCHR